MIAPFRLLFLLLITMFFLVLSTKAERLAVGWGRSQPFIIDRRLPADVNRDQVVDISDLVIVAMQFGQFGKQLIGDLNDDGTVSILDLVIVANQFGQLIIVAPQQHQNQLKEISFTNEQQERLTKALSCLTRSDLDPIFLDQVETLLEQLNRRNQFAKQHQLMLNYPNPFNPETWIPYQLATATNARFLIYDVDGNVVRRLLLGYQLPGLYVAPKDAIYWDGYNQAGQLVASGLYYGVLETEDDLKLIYQYQPMILLK